MSCRYCIDGENQLGVVTIRGRVTGQDVSQVLNTLFSDPAWQPTHNSLWDGRRIQQLDLQPDHVADLLKQAEALRLRRGPGKTAIVVERDLDYALARFFSLAIKHPTRPMQVFRSLAAAQEWLGVPAGWDLPPACGAPD